MVDPLFLFINTTRSRLYPFSRFLILHSSFISTAWNLFNISLSSQPDFFNFIWALISVIAPNLYDYLAILFYKLCVLWLWVDLNLKTTFLFQHSGTQYALKCILPYCAEHNEHVVPSGWTTSIWSWAGILATCDFTTESCLCSHWFHRF